MKKTEIASMAMQKTVLKVMEKYASRWNDWELVQEEVAALRSFSSGADESSQVQTDTVTNGYTSQKRNAHKAMLDATHKNALKLKVWAQKTGNTALLESVSFSRGSMDQQKDREQINLCKSIYRKMETHLPALKAYQVSAESNAALKGLIEAAENSAVDRNLIGNLHHVATGDIATHIRTVGEVLKTLDDLIKCLSGEADAAFVAEYFAARKVSHYRTATAKATKQNEKKEAKA